MTFAALLNRTLTASCHSLVNLAIHHCTRETSLKSLNLPDHQAGTSQMVAFDVYFVPIFALLTIPKPLTAWITINWEILKEMGIPDHLTCLLRHLYVDQEATVRTELGKTDWFQTRKGLHQGCLLSPCLFNLYAEYIIRNTRLDEAQAGIKIARRNLNNLRHADTTTLMAESEEELKSLL